MGNCQTKGATGVAERQPAIHSRSYSLDLGDDDDESTVPNAHLLVTKASDEDNNTARQGPKDNEHNANINNIKPLEPSDLSQTISAKLASDQTTQPQDTRPNIPRVPQKATNNGRQDLYPSVSFPIMDELDELVASMSMPMELTEGEFDMHAEDDAGYVSSSSSSAGTPQAMYGAMVPFTGTPDPIVNVNANANTNVNASTTTDACTASASASASRSPYEPSSAIETRLALTESKNSCAYGLSKEEIEAAAASSTSTTHMVVVDEHQNIRENAQVPASRHFTFHHVKEEEEKEENQLCEQHTSNCATLEMMLTPPNDPDKAYPQDMYLSPPTPENELVDDVTDGFLVALPVGEEIDNARTFDIVPHPTVSHNYGAFLSSADTAISKPVDDQEQDKTSYDKPRGPSQNDEVAPPLHVGETHAIVKFTSASLVPVPDLTPQANTSPKRSPVESSCLTNSLVPFEQVGEDKFVHYFSDEDREDTSANDRMESKARDMVEKRSSSDEVLPPVEGEIEVQLGGSGSMVANALVSSTVDSTRESAEESKAIVEANQSLRNAYADVGNDVTTAEESKAIVEAKQSLRNAYADVGNDVTMECSANENEARKEGSDGMSQSNLREINESGNGGALILQSKREEVKFPVKTEPRGQPGPPCPESATSKVAVSTAGVGSAAEGPDNLADKTSGIPSSGKSVASMTHLSRRARNLRKNKSRVNTKKNTDDTDVSETVPVDYLCIAESRSVDTEVSDLYSVVTDATPSIPIKEIVTATEGSGIQVSGKMSHRSAQIERLRSRSTVRRGPVRELPTTAPSNSGDIFATNSEQNVCVLPPKAADSCGPNDESSRHSSASARKLAKVRQTRSRSRSISGRRTAPSVKTAKADDVKDAVVNQEDTKGFGDSPMPPSPRTNSVSPEDSNGAVEKSARISDEDSLVSREHSRFRSRSTSITRTGAPSEQTDIACTSDTASVEQEKSTCSAATEISGPSRSLSRTRLRKQKVRAARMKAASQQTLSCAGSFGSSPSIEAIETSSTTESNGENNASASNTCASTNTGRVDKGSVKPFGELSSKEAMKKKRLERARRLRAIQH